jgi:2-polyprenyl-3-methyl-5-hydroxy-6-metoxy-1,4-benzoquinol methylase
VSLAYRFLYRIGFTPWEQMGEEPLADKVVSLFEREETGRQPPYGPALDIGCGSGIWASKLARRGSTSAAFTTSSATRSAWPRDGR